MKYRINKSAVYILKKLTATKISVVSVRPLALMECEVEIERKDEKKFKKLFNIKTSIRPHRHLAIIAMIFAAIFLFLGIFLQRYIFNVVINTQTEQVKSDIWQLINRAVFPKSYVNRSELEQLIMQHPRVNLCSVQIKGMTLVINIKEAEEVLIDKETPVVSTAEGIVESVNVVSGTALVRRGDYVKIGDILIAPELIINGETRKASAIGQVGILAYMQKTEVFCENRDELTRTGAAKTKNRWTFWHPGDKIKIGKVKYQFYETTTETCKAAFGGILPLYLTKIKIYELENRKIYENFEDNKTRILGTVLEKVKQQAGEHTVFYSENVAHNELLNGVYEIIATVQFLVYCN